MTFRLALRVEEALPAVLRSPDFEVPRDGFPVALHWSPSSAVEHVGSAEAERMFRALHTTYATAVERVCPWLARAPAFERWRDD